MGNLTLVVAALSYTGQLNLTAAADQDSCPDLEVFAHGMRSALDDLERSVLGLETSGRAGATESSLRAVGDVAIGGGQ
jgi:diacylglycerol O-acyltransferase